MRNIDSMALAVENEMGHDGTPSQMGYQRPLLGSKLILELVSATITDPIKSKSYVCLTIVKFVDLLHDLGAPGIQSHSCYIASNRPV